MIDIRRQLRRGVGFVHLTKSMIDVAGSGPFSSPYPPDTVFMVTASNMVYARNSNSNLLHNAIYIDKCNFDPRTWHERTIFMYPSHTAMKKSAYDFIHRDDKTMFATHLFTTALADQPRIDLSNPPTSIRDRYLDRATSAISNTPFDFRPPSPPPPTMRVSMNHTASPDWKTLMEQVCGAGCIAIHTQQGGHLPQLVQCATPFPSARAI